MPSVNSIKSAYIKEMLNNGIRSGRNLMDYRDISIVTGLIPNAEGSAEVNLGSTKVLVGVKLDVDEPMPDKPNEGNIITSAELLPLASAEYDIGPPSPEAIELARVVDRGIRAAGVIDTESLFISEGKVWSVFIDIYIMNYDGNLFDASTLAAVAALKGTRMPKYENDAVIREGKLSKLKTNNIVTSCTYAKIGSKIILDPDGDEESVMDARLTIANDESYIRAMQKGLSGSFNEHELEMLVDTTFEKSKFLRSILNKLSD
ncbi:MAG: exosome complex protein Rrp42 [Candidatus Micrarchaeia archaeon]|jgi:exosome complex component RRP42